MKIKLDGHEIAILYVMKMVGAANSADLTQIFEDAQIIEYFFGIDILHDFEQQGFVEQQENGLKITQKGLEICEFYGKKLPSEIKEKIEKSCGKIMGEKNGKEKFIN